MRLPQNHIRRTERRARILEVLWAVLVVLLIIAAYAYVQD